MTIDLTTRNLLIGLCSHMSYMQGQLEALHQLDDPDGHYWYRESVALRQKVADHLAALADGPAVPEGREPAAVTGQPSDGELLELWHGSDWYNEGATLREFCSIARAVLARWGKVAPVPVAVSDALIKAECALSDIAEGEPMTDEGDPLKWAERRCADTLAVIRPTMMQHKIRTSEWPPVAATAKPLPEVDE